MPGSDFLVAPQATEMSGLVEVTQAQASIRNALLSDTIREISKDHPEVLALTKVQGSNLVSTTKCAKVYFEVGGQPVTVHKVMIWSTYDGDCAVSVVSFSDLLEGFVVTDSPTILGVDLDSLYVVSDGANPFNINGGNAGHGGLYIYGFTVPVRDEKFKMPLRRYDEDNK